MSHNASTKCLHADSCSNAAVPLPSSVFQLCRRHLSAEYPGPDVARYRRLLDQYGYGR